MQRERGFTLLELVVALTVLGLLSGISFGLLKTSTLAWNKASRVSNNLELVEAVQSVLRRELSAVMPPNDNRLFVGNTHFLSIWTPLPGALNGNGFAEVRLVTEEKDGHKNMILLWRPQKDKEWQKSILLAHIKDNRFSYFSSRGGWQSIWTDRKKLPEAIRVDISFPARDTRIWPEFVIAPKLTISAACRYKAADRECSGR